jgi:sporulation protein YlmC with PRC-barrel domain
MGGTVEDKALYGQLYGKYAVDIEGTIRGYVDDVDVQFDEGEITFQLEMHQVNQMYQRGLVERSRFGPKVRLTIRPKDIVSVGKDCIIIGFGRVPDLKDLDRFKIIVAENEGLHVQVRECAKERDAALAKLKEREDEVLELRDRLRLLKRKEEEYDLLKEELAKKKGELEATQVYIRHIDKLDERLTKLLKNLGREDEGEDRIVP